VHPAFGVPPPKNALIKKLPARLLKRLIKNVPETYWDTRLPYQKKNRKKTWDRGMAYCQLERRSAPPPFPHPAEDRFFSPTM